MRMQKITMEVDIKDLLLKLVTENEDLSDDSDILDSGDELPNVVEAKIPTKFFWEMQVSTYSDATFIREFRISRELFKELANNFKESNYYKNLQSTKAHSPEKHLAVFLWFAGREACSYRELARRFDLSLSTVFSYIRRCTRFVSSLSEHVILWPDDNEKFEAEEYYREAKMFPNMIGSIGVTRIRIDAPKGSLEDYSDRLGNTTICMQAICNEKAKFIDVSIGLGGSIDDSIVFRSSEVYAKLPERCKNFYLLGDRTYPCTEHLITPYRDDGHLTPVKETFNVMHNSARDSLKLAFGTLRQRFRQLYYCKLKGVEHICHFIRACCVLHNLADPLDLEVMENMKENIPEQSSGNKRECLEYEEEATILGKRQRNLLAHQLYKRKNKSIL